MSQIQLNIDLQILCSKWKESDAHFAKILTQDSKHIGIRILNQSPFETLVSFICSANNNIKRISGNFIVLFKMILSINF
jgi:N-glycosylase/DNA lyase